MIKKKKFMSAMIAKFAGKFVLLTLITFLIFPIAFAQTVVCGITVDPDTDPLTVPDQGELSVNIELNGIVYIVNYEGNVNKLKIYEPTGKLADLAPDDFEELYKSVRALYRIRETNTASLVEISRCNNNIVNTVIDNEEDFDTVIMALDVFSLPISGYASEGLVDNPTISDVFGLNFVFNFNNISHAEAVADAVSLGFSNSSYVRSLSNRELQKNIAHAAYRRILDSAMEISDVSPRIQQGFNPLSETVFTVGDIESMWISFSTISADIAIQQVVMEEIGESSFFADAVNLGLSLFGWVPGVNWVVEYLALGVGVFFDGLDIADSAATKSKLIELWQSGEFSGGVRIPEFDELGQIDLQIRLGSSGSDFIQGTSSMNELISEAGDDKLFGGSGNDVLNGGSGLDTVFYNGTRLSHHVVRVGSNEHSVMGPDGTDVLIDIELISFSGQTGIPIDSAVDNVGNDDNTGGQAPPPNDDSSGAPDLVSAVTNFPDGVVSGSFVSVDFAVSNIGDGYANSAPLGLYMSVDSIPSSNDSLLGAVYLPGIAAGQSYSGTIARQTENWVAGEYYLYVVSDSDTQSFSTSYVGEIVEQEEGNNASNEVAISLVANPNSIGGSDGDSSIVDSVNGTDGLMGFIGDDIGNSPNSAFDALEFNEFVVSVTTPGDADWYEFDFIQGESYAILTYGFSANGFAGLADTFFRVRDGSGTVLPPTRDVDITAAGDDAYDDILGGSDALLVYTAGYSGTHYISVGAGGQNFANLSGTYLFVVADGNIPTVGPDLEIQSLSISDETVTLGQSVIVDFELENSGDEDANEAEVDIFLSTTTELNGTVYRLLTWSDSSGLDAGESISVEVDAVVPTDVFPGEYYLVAFADPDADIDEVIDGEGNNLFVYGGMIEIEASEGPDIDMINSVSLSTTSLENGESLTVYWSAENDGDAESPIAETHFYLSADQAFDINEDLYLDTDGLRSLDVNEREDDDETLTIPDHVFEGEYYIVVVADGENEIFEQNEINNVEDSPRLTITDNLRPDLIIRAAELDFDSLDSLTLIEGQEGNIDYVIENIGDVDATRDNRNVTVENTSGERVEVFAFLSTDQVYSTDDFFLGSEGAGGMSVGEANSESISFTFPPHYEFGTYYILTQADGHGTFPEIYEDNNFGEPQLIKYGAGSIGDGPDYFLANVVVDLSNAIPGGEINIDYDVFNHGNQEGDFDISIINLLTTADTSTGEVIYEKVENGTILEIGERGGEGDSIDIPIDILPGSYFIHVEVNPNRTAIESDYTNNSISPIEIVVISNSSVNDIDSDGDGVLDDDDVFPNDPTESADSDGDGVGDNGDAFPNDSSETNDTDGDGVGDNADVFPNNVNESLDSDGDGIGDNSDAFPNNAFETIDSDGDGVGDNADAFPNNGNESLDSDGDGVGDNSDAFPNNANESLDSDGDGIGDNSDVFPNNDQESEDSDGDGVGDNGDAFPNDDSETNDSDNDGVGDNSDAFPNDDSESIDSDGDGVGDNGDVFPNNASETLDTDGDGVGNNADAFPNDPNRTTQPAPESQSGGGGVLEFSSIFLLLLVTYFRRKRVWPCDSKC